eukprot:scaffold205_cov407-Prasinococcus_capsulatus_cf.AAC.6
MDADSAHHYRRPPFSIKMMQDIDDADGWAKSETARARVVGWSADDTRGACAAHGPGGGGATRAG